MFARNRILFSRLVLAALVLALALPPAPVLARADGLLTPSKPAAPGNLTVTDIAHTSWQSKESPEKCWGLWKVKLCVKARIDKDRVEVGAKAIGSPYVWVTIYKNGCYYMNPTKLLVDVRVCVSDFKKSVTSKQISVSFKLSMKACIGAWKLKTCESTDPVSIHLTFP